MVSIDIRTSIFILFIFSVSVAGVKSQLCVQASQYDRCSSNSSCACFHLAADSDVGICADQYVDCSKLQPCESSNNKCSKSQHVCVRHPRCSDLPVCYPLSNRNLQLCPPISNDLLRSISINILPNARWQQNSTIVAGGNGEGNALNQLKFPYGLYVDDDQTVYVVDQSNSRIMKWKPGETSGEVVAGGNGKGDGNHQLSDPFDITVDRVTDSVIICDHFNKRVVRWPRRNGKIGETILANISCNGLAMDNEGSLYVSVAEKNEVRRYQRDTTGTLVAGGNGAGSRLDQLYVPMNIFVDRDQSVYVSEGGNHRVTKWVKGAKQGIVVAGGQSYGNGLQQFSSPRGVFVDQLDTVYVSDGSNSRVMRWPKGAIKGTIIAGGNGGGKQLNQLHWPSGLSFDQYGNLYVVDNINHQVQKFNLEYNG